jgi:anti-sigma regulatory factor (Ser/Thr protein kinase)
MGQNAIEWGNRRCESELVHITYRIREDQVEIIVRDKGCGFDPSDLPHAASGEDPLSHMEVRECMGLRDGGFGLLIARGLLDELRHNERGNEVTLVKRFPSRVAETTVH